MRKIQFIIFNAFAAALLLYSCGSNDSETAPQESAPLTEAEKGQAIYKKYCVACHGMNGKMGMNGAKDLTQSELTLTERKLLIANGKNTMTPFKSILSAEEISLVAKYTLSLSDENE